MTDIDKTTMQLHRSCRHRTFMRLCLLLIVFFAIEGIAQAQVVVSLSRTGAAVIDEGSVSMSGFANIAGGKIAFTVRLSRALKAGESINVPLIISGSDITTRDFNDLRLATDASNTGVTLQDIGTLNPTVIFQGKGARTAALELEAFDNDYVGNSNNNPESAEETATMSLGTSIQSSNVTENVTQDGSKNSFAVTVRDDEYIIGFQMIENYIPEDIGHVMIPMVVQGNLIRDIKLQFFYLDFPAAINEDYRANFVLNSGNFLTVKRKTTNFFLRLQILADEVDEDPEVLFIRIATPQVPAGHLPNDGNVIIVDNLPTLSIVGTSVYEGNAAPFTVTSNRISTPTAVTANLHVSEAAGSDYVISANEGNKQVSIAANQSTAVLNVPTVDYSAARTVGRIIVELRAPSSPTDYFIGIPASASAKVRHAGSIDVRSRVFLEGSLR